jgi:hypothetical protein
VPFVLEFEPQQDIEGKLAKMTKAAQKAGLWAQPATHGLKAAAAG